MTTQQVLDAVRDPDRLEALQRLGLLDTPAEPAFDRLTRIASRLLGVPVALVSLVDFGRQFFKSQVGLTEPWASARETPLTHSFCKHIVASREPLVVSDAREHPMLNDNLAVAELGVVAYAGVPLFTSTGAVLGAMCTIDGKPREWTSNEIETLHDLAAAVMTETELRSELLNVREIETALRQAKEDAELANCTKSEFLTNMSHELRTPLNSVIGFSNVLLKNATGNLDARQSQFLQRIKSNGEHLLGLINEILDLSKIESGRIELDLTAVSVNDLVNEVVRDLEGRVAESMVELIAEVPERCIPIESDACRLKQILINLVGNGIKFTPSGRVTVRVHAPNADEPPRCIDVIDTGVGIPADRQQRIFEAFRQADSTTSRKYGGTGLGLAISRSLAAELGYRLTLNSEPDCGSTFRLDLRPE